MNEATTTRAEEIFHIIFDFAVNLEAYHLTIRGANLGSYDGVDAIGTNYWIHDIEVRIM